MHHEGVVAAPGRQRDAARPDVARRAGAALIDLISGRPSAPTGIVSGAHAVPLKRRTDVVPPAAPAAQTLVGELAVTDASAPPPPRFGSVASDHAPFQCIAIGLSGKKLPDFVSMALPTPTRRSPRSRRRRSAVARRRSG